MGWIIHKDDSITIKLHEKGYYTICVIDDFNPEWEVQVNVSDPSYFRTLAKVLEDVAHAIENVRRR